MLISYYGFNLRARWQHPLKPQHGREGIDEHYRSSTQYNDDLYPFLFSEDRARDLAETIGGDALSLADLENFHPEDGMVLANTTSIGMQPKIDETPIPKVDLF